VPPGLDLTRYMEQVLDVQQETLAEIQKVKIELARELGELHEWRRQIDGERGRGWQVRLALAAAFLSLLSNLVIWKLSH
jgi:hypothetical protein